MSTGILLPFERGAMDNMPLPDGLSLEDQSMYLALRYLYAAHRQKLIDRHQASAEKGRLLHECEKRKRQANSARKQSDHTVAMWKGIEGHASTYRKSRKAIDTTTLPPEVLAVLEAGDKLMDAIDGKITGWNQIGMEVEQIE